MGSRGNLRKARFYSVLCAEENHRAETGGGVAAAVGCSGGDGISRHEKKLGLLIAGRPSAFCNSRAPADWLGFLDLHSKRRYAPLDLRNTGSSGSRGPHVPAGRMSRGPHSYRHQRRLTTLSISLWCTFAMADAGRPFGRKRCCGKALNAALVKLESVEDGTCHAARHRHTARAR